MFDFFLFLILKICCFLKFTVPNQNYVVVSIIPSAFGFWTIRRFIAATIDRCKLAVHNDDHFYTTYYIIESPRPLCTPCSPSVFFFFFCLHLIFNNCNHPTDAGELHTDYHCHDCYYHYHHYYSNKINTTRSLFFPNNRARLGNAKFRAHVENASIHPSYRTMFGCNYTGIGQRKSVSCFRRF